MNAENAFLVTSISYFIIALISYLIILFVLIFILRRLIRVLKQNITVFSADLNARLLGLGIAVLVFPRVIPALFLAFIRSFYTLLAIAPARLFMIWTLNIEPCSVNTDMENCIRTLLGGYLQEWSNILEPIGERFIRLPYQDLVLFIVLWALAATILHYFTDGQDTQDQESRVHNLFENVVGRIGRTTISNISLIIVLLFAVYLSLAAIIAIPILQQQTQTFQEVSEDNLRVQLEDELSRFDASYSDEIGLSDPLQEVRNLLTSHETSVAANEPGTTVTETATITTTLSMTQTESAEPTAQLDIPEDVYRQLSLIVNDMDSNRDNLQTDWQNLNAAINGQLLSAKERALTSYRVSNLDRLGSEENFSHFLQINSWFSEQVNAGDTMLNQCRGLIEGYDNSLQNWSLGVTANLQSETNLNYIMLSAPRLTNSTTCDAGRFTIDADLPQRQAFGASQGGPYGFVAGWLLETESLSVAIVTGMLGFGLLGAAFASFVRHRSQRQPGDPLVKEFLSDFLIPGFSATIIVFLAVKGGLVVFSGPDSDPNPYILFFICTVAAVFNQDIWNWAEETLGNIFSTNGAPDPIAQNGPPPVEEEE